MRLIRFLINWTICLSCPLWGGTLVAIVMLAEFFRGDKIMAANLSGQRWMWE